MLNTSKMWSRTPAPVRNLHVLLKSSRVSSLFRRILDTFNHDWFFFKIWNLSLLSIKETVRNVIKDPSPSQEPPHPHKLQQCHHSSGGFPRPLFMTDFYETWNVGLLSSNKHIQSISKVQSPNQEPVLPPNLDQSIFFLDHKKTKPKPQLMKVNINIVLGK